MPSAFGVPAALALLAMLCVGTLWKLAIGLANQNSSFLKAAMTLEQL
jgi:hypothetical protein